MVYPDKLVCLYVMSDTLHERTAQELGSEKGRWMSLMWTQIQLYIYMKLLSILPTVYGSTEMPQESFEVGVDKKGVFMEGSAGRKLPSV